MAKQNAIWGDTGTVTHTLIFSKGLVTSYATA